MRVPTKAKYKIVQLNLVGMTSERFVSCVENCSAGSVGKSLKHPLPSF